MTAKLKFKPVREGSLLQSQKQESWKKTTKTNKMEFKFIF